MVTFPILQNLKAWEEAKLAIQAIEPHPNKPLQMDEDEPSRSQPSRSPQQQRSFTVDRSRTEMASGSLGFGAMDSGFATSHSKRDDDEDAPPPPGVKDHPL